MAKEGHLPGFFAKAIESTRERLFVTVMVSALLIVFLNLLQIAAVGSITVLFIHAVTHLGRILKLLRKLKHQNLW
jgi:sensor histidine kinase YesM